MKKFTSLLLGLIALISINSCNSNDNQPYIVSSGSGSLAVGSNISVPLYKFVFEPSEYDYTLLLLGGTASVNSDNAYLTGSGPIVSLTIPNSEGVDSLYSMNVTIDGGNTTLAYSTEKSFDNTFFLPNTSDMVTLTSGTAIITVSGKWYVIRILGKDEDENSIVIGYAGYIYAYFDDLF